MGRLGGEVKWWEIFFFVLFPKKKIRTNTYLLLVSVSVRFVPENVQKNPKVVLNIEVIILVVADLLFEVYDPVIPVY